MKAVCFNGGSTSFYHSGDYGDIIYSLLFAREFAPIRLCLGPDSPWEVRERLTPERFEWLAPLLRRQPWIESVEYAQRIPVPLDCNLNEFRRVWFSPRSGCSRKRRLFETYAETFKHSPLPEDKAWLSADPVRDAQRPVVINRTERFHNDNFPWKRVSNGYAGRMRFVGLPEEYEVWSAEYGKSAEYCPVSNALELANIISGASLFIGNQSFPMALALALNVRVIQETNKITPDCVFNRVNATYTHLVPLVELPPLPVAARRFVTPKPNRDGVFELGPCADAWGLGDTLSIVPLVRALNGKCIVTLPESMRKQAFVFRGLCDVQFSDDYPVIAWNGTKQVAQFKLDMFGVNGDPVPRIELDDNQLESARKTLAQYPSPIAFCPTSSRHWAHIRQPPDGYWIPVLSDLAKRHTILQFGLPTKQNFDGAVKMPFVDLENLAHLYAVIGGYVGVNTGDYHLMMAVGGKCAVVNPHDIPAFNPVSWNYNRPDRVRYANMIEPKSMLDCLETLSL